MKKSIIALCLVLIVMHFEIYAQVTVVKKAQEINPALFFKGVAGNSSFSENVLKDLTNCGWFNIVNSSSNSKYQISGKIENDAALLNINGASSFSLSLKMNKSNSRITSAKLVDGVLNKIFNVPGICNTNIAFAGQNGRIKEIYTCGFDGSSIKRLTNNKNLSLDPDWGIANRLLVYTYYHNNFTDVVGINLNTGKTYKLADFPGLNSGGAVSPNGKYLAVVLSKDKRVELYVKKLFGKGMKRLTYDEAVEGSPTWSPDGMRICFVSDKSLGSPKLYIVNVNSAKVTAIKTIGTAAVTPDWSFFADKIVYSSRFGKQYTLAVYDVKTGISSPVKINASGDWMSPAWAPDGRHVVCSRKLNYHSQLYIVDTWTGKARKFFSSKMDIYSPSWSDIR